MKRTLNATDKTDVKAKRQAKRWFSKNPNRKVVDMKISATKTITVKREDVLS